MGVYIKGMKMPKDGFECEFQAYDNSCNALDEAIICDELNHRHPNCPLVEIAEPHGRLIDADMLTGMISKKTAEPEYQHTGEDWRIGLYLADELTYEVPTIIEAESEE